MKHLFLFLLCTVSLNLSAQDATPVYKQCPDDNHPHLIDLGLPFGTKWACCNVGAKKPEERGGLYSWGETEEKSDYSWKNYKHCDGGSKTMHRFSSSISGTENDVAHMKWGDNWQMPIYEQFIELLNNCKKEFITIGEVKGYRFTGPNGASIFLPSEGSSEGLVMFGVDMGSIGYYWSSNQCPSYLPYAEVLTFSSNKNPHADNTYCNNGHCVRPVYGVQVNVPAEKPKDVPTVDKTTEQIDEELDDFGI